MKMTVHPHSFSRSGASRQRGLVLMLVLIVLGILALAGAAVMRSVDTGNTIAGNHSFQQSALHASERAVADAMAFLPNRVAAGTSGSNLANRYFATRQTALDARGFPANINWDNVDCVDERGIAAATRCNGSPSGCARPTQRPAASRAFGRFVSTTSIWRPPSSRIRARFPCITASSYACAGLATRTTGTRPSWSDQRGDP
jgi:Tfp pilus assembly protein PilX